MCQLQPSLKLATPAFLNKGDISYLELLCLAHNQLILASLPDVIVNLQLG